MQTATETAIEAIYTFTGDLTHVEHDGQGQHDERLTFDHEPGEAEFIQEALSRLDPDQLRALVKISTCQLDEGEALPWLDDGKYHFQR